MKNATQLKALIRNLSKEKNINAQILMRNYILERLLERISLSEYKHSFILKGGMLVAAIVGLDTRSTMDMDATIKGIAVTREAVQAMFEKILAVTIDDGVVMSIKNIEDIRDESDYTGLRISLDAIFDGIKQSLKVDITTGDTITPTAILYSFKLMFESRSIEVMAYNLETVLAEKLETVVSRSTLNTRMRDYYDIFILSKMQKDDIDYALLEKALTATTERRGTTEILSRNNQIVSEVKKSEPMQDLWKRYQKQFDYAADISWNDVMEALTEVLLKSKIKD